MRVRDMGAFTSPIPSHTIYRQALMGRAALTAERLAQE